MAEKEKNRVAVITGAGSGIGAATAVRFAKGGYDVAVNYRSREDEALAVVEACKANGVDAIAVQGDIADGRDCPAIAAAVAERWGRVDALVNSAGVTVSAPQSDLEALETKDFAKVFGVNVVGNYHMVRAVWPLLRQSSAASIVNVSTSGSLTGLGSSIAYAASKGALNIMTLSMARSLAPHVRVNTVCPGVVDTGWRLQWMSTEEYEAFRTKELQIAPLQRIASADEIAEAIHWLSTAAPSMTGQIITIDNGVNLKLGVV
ncbi:SDR family NAD(P)-dependent oxidoreductase [Mesorhizobium sp. 10J20-29]